MQVKAERDLGMVAFFSVHQAGGNYLGCGQMDKNVFQRMLSFFYGLDLVNTNLKSKFDTTMKISGLAIDICRSWDRLRQDLYTYLNGQGLCNYAPYTELIRPWTSVAYLVQGTTMSEVANEYLTPLGLTSISPVATSSVLNNKNLYPYYLRTVPPDSLQAEAMTEILQLFKWDYFTAVYSDVGYGQMGMKNIKEILEKKKAGCLTESLKMSLDADLNEAIKIVKRLDSYKYVRVVILFTFTSHTRLILEAAHQLQLVGRFTWIGGDDWANRESVTKGLEDVARGAITIQLRSEPVPGFRKWVKELTLTNRKGIPDDWFEEYWQHTHKCRLTNSIVRQTQYARQCDQDEKIVENQVMDDPVILHNIIATYVTAWGLSSTTTCKGEGIDDCLWRLKKDRKHQLIYDAIRAAQWKVLEDELGDNSFQFKFTEQGFGDIGYSILNYRLKGASTTEYGYKRVSAVSIETEMILFQSGTLSAELSIF